MFALVSSVFASVENERYAFFCVDFLHCLQYALARTCCRYVGHTSCKLFCCKLNEFFTTELPQVSTTTYIVETIGCSRRSVSELFAETKPVFAVLHERCEMISQDGRTRAAFGSSDRHYPNRKQQGHSYPTLRAPRARLHLLPRWDRPLPKF